MRYRLWLLDVAALSLPDVAAVLWPVSWLRDASAPALGHTNVETTVRYILGGDVDQLVAAATAMQSASAQRTQ